MSISVIVYVKDAVETIQRCIDSVLSQSDVNFELVIVDGASTDGTLQLVKDYGGKIHTLVSEPDSGPVEAANKGMSLATGEIMMFLMADDWLEERALHRIVAGFVANPHVDILSSGVRVVDERAVKNQRKPLEVRGCKNALTIENLLARPYAAARYWRRRYFDRFGGLDPSILYAHDRDWFMRAYLSGTESAIVDDMLYNYSEHEGSTTLGGNRWAVRNFVSEHVVLAERWAKMCTFPSIRRKILRWRRYQMAELFWLDISLLKFRDAAADLWKFSIIDPVFLPVCLVLPAKAFVLSRISFGR